MIRGCIFDGDGTIIDSMPIWLEIGPRFLTRHGIPFPPTLAAELGPLGLNGTVQLLQERFAVSAPPEDILNELWADITSYYQNEAPCKPGIKALLAELKRRGIPMVLTTAGDLSLLGPAMEREGISHYFAACLSCDELHTTKNEPLIYQKAAEYMGLSPQETAVFEDAPYALESAGRAGCLTIRISEPAFASKAFPPVGLFLEDCTDITAFLTLAGLE